LRDEFAMAAVAGLLMGNRYADPEAIAKQAYAYSDALLRERAK